MREREREREREEYAWKHELVQGKMLPTLLVLTPNNDQFFTKDVSHLDDKPNNANDSNYTNTILSSLTKPKPNPTIELVDFKYAKCLKKKESMQVGGDKRGNVTCDVQLQWRPAVRQWFI